MRIAVCDFDGTLFERGKHIGDVLPAIAAWRQAGNLLGIATGRDHNMIHDGLRRSGITADFIVCLNGAMATAPDGTVLFRTPLVDELVPALVRHPAADASTHIQLSGGPRTKAVLRKDSWFSKIGIDFDAIREDEAVLLQDLVQISLAYHSDDEALAWRERILADFPGQLAAHPNRISIDLNAYGVDKADGVSRLVHAMNWQDETILPIGDGQNDIGMITRFGGFTLDHAAPSVQAVARKSYPDVPAMLAEWM